MAKAWQSITGDDLWQVVSRELVLKCDEDSAGGSEETDDLDTGLDSRANKAVEHAVAEVRGAIESAGRYPLSITAGTVPPEGVQHTLVIAAWRLCAIKPSLLAVMLADGGAMSPLKGLYDKAVKWVEGLGAGATFVLPTDPTGEDYATAVSATNLAISGIRWGDSLADDREYAAGETDDGIVVSRLSQNMNTQ